EGSHLSHKIPEPWCHLTMQHSTLHERLASAVPNRSEFLTLWGTYRTLNRITATELIGRVRDAGCDILRTWTEKDETRQPPPDLRAIFREETLLTHQVVVLAKRRD